MNTSFHGRPSLSHHNNIVHNQLMNSQPQGFDFPVIEPSEIVLCLNELGINYISEDDIRNPDKCKEQIRRLYDQLSEICLGTSRDELAQPVFSGLQALSYPELHEDSIPQINSYRACCRMMEVCGITKFCIKDFLCPLPKRFQKILSGVVNFAKFKEDRLTLLTELESSKVSLVEKLLSVKEKNETLSKRALLLRDQTAEENDLIFKIEGDCKDIENKISTLNIQQASIREESTQLKISNNKLKDEISLKTMELEDLAESKKKLSGQIVTSPEKFRKQIIDVGQSLKAEQNDAKAAEKKIRELLAWISNVDEAQTDVSAALESVHDLRMEVEKQKSVLCDIDNLRQSLQSKKQVLSELDQNVLYINKQVYRTDEKLQLIRKQVTGRNIETEKTIESLHHQILQSMNVKTQVYILISLIH